MACKSRKRSYAEAAITTQQAQNLLETCRRTCSDGQQLERSRANLADQCVSIPSCASCSSRPAKLSWCEPPLMLYEIDWQAAMFELDDLPVIHSQQPQTHLKELSLTVVEKDDQLQPALSQLLRSMQDAVLAIDLEWRPDRRTSSSNPVAMVQLASSQHALIVRTCLLGGAAHQILCSFLRRSELILIGLGWDCCDERKMQTSFGMGRADFAAFLDLAHIGKALGYSRPGLANLSKQVLGLDLQKSKALSMSDWQRRVLSSVQIRYAACDVLIAGAIYRSLRFWHARDISCRVCLYPYGSVIRAAQATSFCSTPVLDERDAVQMPASRIDLRLKHCLACARQVPDTGPAEMPVSYTSTT